MVKIIVNPNNFWIPEKFLQHLGSIHQLVRPTLSGDRISKLEAKVQQRSRAVLTVLEETYHPHNISAVMRSVDAFGFCEVHHMFNEPVGNYRPRDSVERGSAQWLCVSRAANNKENALKIKERGYKIVLVTSPEFHNTNSFFNHHIPAKMPLEFWDDEFKNLIQNHRLAMVFGNEKYGLSPFWFEIADCVVFLPMHGFVESLNISVCAGILLQRIRELVDQIKVHQLDSLQQKILLEYWIIRSSPLAYQLMRTHQPALSDYFDFIKNALFIHGEPKVHVL